MYSAFLNNKKLIINFMEKDIAKDFDFNEKILYYIDSLSLDDTDDDTFQAQTWKEATKKYSYLDIDYID